MKETNPIVWYVPPQRRDFLLPSHQSWETACKLCSQERLTRGTVTSTMRKMCKVRCWHCLFGNKIPFSLCKLRWLWLSRR